MIVTCRACGEELDEDFDPETDGPALCEGCEVEGVAARMMIEDYVDRDED